MTLTMNKRKRPILLLLTLILSLASVGLAAAMMISGPAELLTDALETLDAAGSGHAIVQATADLPQRSVSGEVEIWVQRRAGPNGEPAFRLVVLSASEANLVGATAVSDGSQFWLYDQARNTVVTGRTDEMAAALAAHLAERANQGDRIPDYDPESFDRPETPEEAVARLLEYVTAERNGSETLPAGEAHRLRLVPIPEQMPDEARAAGGYVTLWLRQDDRLPLALEYAEGSLGDARVEATLAEIDLVMDPGLFQFEIPAGATVIPASELLTAHAPDPAAPAAAEYTALMPRVLPDGAVAAGPRRIGGALVQRYDRPDGSSFVLAQGPSRPLNRPAEATRQESINVRGVTGTLYSNEAGSRSLLAWEEGDTTIVVGGDITPAEALALAESLP